MHIINSNQVEVISVSEFNNYLSNYLKTNPFFNYVKVKGEIGTIKFSSSGHVYLNLKDDDSLISVNVWKSTIQKLDSSVLKELKEGSKIIVEGSVQIYEKGGTYNLIAQKISLDGMGDLYKRFLVLKDKLQQKGLFDQGHKKPIKRFNYSVGVITSKTGAVIRDIISTIKRRFPNVNLTIYNTPVQGKNIEPEIIENLLQADKANHDVIIMARGGGSLEDLWCFNDEQLALEVFAAKTPIISAIGHETDFTILDFVADLRAPTPTAAAEMINPFYKDVWEEINKLNSLFTRAINSFLDQRKMSLLSLEQKFAKMENFLEVYKNKVNNLDTKLKTVINTFIQKQSFVVENRKMILYTTLINSLNNSKLRIDTNKQNLNWSTINLLNKQKHHLQVLFHKLDLLNPEQLLEKGYTQIYDSENKLVKSIEKLVTNQEISIHLKDGQINAKIKSIKGKNNG